MRFFRVFVRQLWVLLFVPIPFVVTGVRALATDAISDRVRAAISGRSDLMDGILQFLSVMAEYPLASAILIAVGGVLIAATYSAYQVKSAKLGQIETSRSTALGDAADKNQSAALLTALAERDAAVREADDLRAKMAGFKIPDLSGSITSVMLREPAFSTGDDGARKVRCKLRMRVSMSNPERDGIDVVEAQATAWPLTTRLVQTIRIKSQPELPFTVQGFNNVNVGIDAEIEFDDDGLNTIPDLRLLFVDQYGAKHFAVLHGASLSALKKNINGQEGQ
jgi:hypothetical protein